MNTDLLKSSESEYLMQIRHHLHKHPEHSGDEVNTASFILSELKRTEPDELHEEVGGTGIIAIYGNDPEGPQVMLRSELDALPIGEEGEREHKSVNEGIAHSCGHDGHMAVMVGVARFLKENRPDTGRVIVLFQPSEETGRGAEQMLADPFFKHNRIDRSYAFHNLPGFETGKLYYRKGTFASASVGLEFVFTGVSSHAAYPGQGKNPAMALSSLVRFVTGPANSDATGNSDTTENSGVTGSANTPESSDDTGSANVSENSDITTNSDIKSNDFSITTVTYMRLGERAFGTSPGRGEMGITIRAARDEKMEELKKKITAKAGELADKQDLVMKFFENEPFVATFNSDECMNIVLAAADKAGIPAEEAEHPFPWSEDFGHFSRVSDIALAGIGAGRDHPHLHAEEYDFPDDILSPAVELFKNILKQEWATRIS